MMHRLFQLVLRDNIGPEARRTRAAERAPVPGRRPTRATRTMSTRGRITPRSART
jgi:hypothetical protein